MRGHGQTGDEEGDEGTGRIPVHDASAVVLDLLWSALRRGQGLDALSVMPALDPAPDGTLGQGFPTSLASYARTVSAAGRSAGSGSDRRAT
jgi:hypothetical protein